MKIFLETVYFYNPHLFGLKLSICALLGFPSHTISDKSLPVAGPFCMPQHVLLEVNSIPCRNV
jgi:hypothetical protein